MPDRNFEQQARDMANSFEVTPKPEVWQNVRHAIQPPQRKRRFVLWWWLLPLALLGGSLALYILNNESKKGLDSAKSIIIHQTDTNKTQINPELSGTQSSINVEEHRKETTTKVVSLGKKNSNQGQSETEQVHTATVSPEESIINTYNKSAQANNRISEKSNADGNKLDQNTIATTSMVDSNNQIDKSTTVLRNLSTLTTKDSSIANSPVQDTTKSIITSNQHLDSSANNPASFHSTKPRKHTAWNWGILAEGGIADRKSSVLSFAGLEKSNNIPSAFFLNNGWGSSVTGNPQNSNLYYNSTIKHGAALGLGVALKKELNKNMDFVVDLAYHHQSFKSTTLTYKDSLILNNTFSIASGSYTAAQSFHFTSLFAGINWHFINTKHLQLGISAGADNLLLLSARQKISSVNSSLFTLADVARRSDSTFTGKSFYRYQPSLFTGILINIQMGNRQLQVVPFTRSSFRPFDKNTANTNNHLFSAGVKAVYFFK